MFIFRFLRGRNQPHWNLFWTAFLGWREEKGCLSNLPCFPHPETSSLQQRNVCQVQVGGPSRFLKGTQSRGNVSWVCENTKRNRHLRDCDWASLLSGSLLWKTAEALQEGKVRVKSEVVCFPPPASHRNSVTHVYSLHLLTAWAAGSAMHSLWDRLWDDWTSGEGRRYQIWWGWDGLFSLGGVPHQECYVELGQWQRARWSPQSPVEIRPCNLLRWKHPKMLLRAMEHMSFNIFIKPYPEILKEMPLPCCVRSALASKRKERSALWVLTLHTVARVSPSPSISPAL